MEAWDQPYNASEQKKNAALSKEMFVHAFNSYMSYGFPQDNVRPMSCTPSNSQVHSSVCRTPSPATALHSRSISVVQCISIVLSLSCTR